MSSLNPRTVSCQTKTSISNSPSTITSPRRSRVERNQKRPIVSAVPTPERKRSSTSKISSAKDDDLNLANFPILALTRIYTYLPEQDRIALSKTCRKLRQAEIYARRQRCVFNVRLDLFCNFNEQFTKSRTTTVMTDLFSSIDLFGDMLVRSMKDKAGSVCDVEKIAIIDFSPPMDQKGVMNVKRWGGHTFLSPSSFYFKNMFLPTLIELRLQCCYVPADTLRVISRVFPRLQRLSLSLKWCYVQTTNVQGPDLNDRLIDSVREWSTLITRKKQILNSVYVKQLIIFIYDTFSSLETLMLYE